MSTTSVQTTIEHVVLFKVKDNVDDHATLSAINSLSSLDCVHYLTAGPLHRNKSSPFPFTHFCHARFSSKDNFTAYLTHPHHLSVYKDSFLPYYDVSMALDWVGADRLIPTPQPGAAVRVSFLKVKESLGEEVKEEILGVINGIKESVAGFADQISCGENFNPAMAKGYSIASLAVFPGLAELEALDAKEEVVNVQKDKLKSYLDSVIVVDFVVPSAATV